MPKTDRERLEDNNDSLLRIKEKANNLPDAKVNVTNGTVDGHTLILGETQQYVELEYIQATGTQGIDTGYVPVLGDDIEFRHITIPSQSAGTVFWTPTQQSSGFIYHIGLRVYTQGSGNAAYYSYCGSDTTQYNGDIWLNNGTMYLKPDGKLYYNDTLKVTSTHPTGDVVSNLYLFVSGPLLNVPGVGKMGRIIVKHNNIVQRTFIPVRRISDNEICMYEEVTKTFLTNIGTGSFIAGPEIN